MIGSNGDGVGPPVVKDVWQEAVEVLLSNGGDAKALVQQEMARVYGSDNIAAVAMLHDTAALDAAAAQYCALQEQFEDVLDWYQSRLPAAAADGADVEAPSSQQQQQQQRGGSFSGASPKWHKASLKRKTVLVVGPRYGSWGTERYGVAPRQVDALEFYPAALQQRLGELQALQQAARDSLPRPAAVVTFRRQLVATLAAASLHSYDEAAWDISPAPAPQEVLWHAVGLRSWEVSLRQLALWVAFWLLVVFYAPVVALIQAPVNMDNLMKIPFLKNLLELQFVSSLLQGFLPSLVLLIFLAVLPYLLGLLIRRAGLRSVTAEDSLLTLMYFTFQLFAVFIFSFVSGTALSQLQALLDDPHRIISLLGVSAPQQASFFSTYILLLGLSRTPIQLLRLPQLVLYLLQLQLADSPRQRRRLWSNQQQLLGRVLPLHTLVLLLGLVFCVASPLIAPFTLLYFVSSALCQRYQWLYVYRHPYEGAGTLWKQVFTQVMVAIYFFVAVMGCLLGIKRFEWALLLAPLAVGVLVFHVLAGRLLERPLTLPASREAAAMDAYTLQQQREQQEQQQDEQQDNRGDNGSSSSSSAQGGREAAAAAGAAGKSAAAAAGLPSQVAGSGGQGESPQADLSQLYASPAMQLGQHSLQPLLDEAADINRRLGAAGY
ncbi:hypothetical protein OEZ86_004562 [Tetradesmus obliquus]|nr:hypothetical protein OEZ86_004562 [Tetradesmus obliquus]